MGENADDVWVLWQVSRVMTCVLWQVLGDVEEFEKAVRLVIEDVTFDTDVVVSVFETNIRVLGWVADLLVFYCD